MAIMLITHDMGVVAETAQRVVVMYAGKVVEEAQRRASCSRSPRHPYTQGLIRSIPRIDTRRDCTRCGSRRSRASVPKLIEPRRGCRFAPRCKYATPECIARDAAAARGRRRATRSRCICSTSCLPSDAASMAA